MLWYQKLHSYHPRLQAIQSRRPCPVLLKILAPEQVSLAKDQQRPNLQLSLPSISQKRLWIPHRILVMRILLLNLNPTILRRLILCHRAPKLVQDTPTRGATQIKAAILLKVMTLDRVVIPTRGATLTKAANLIAVRKKAQAQVSLICCDEHLVFHDGSIDVNTAVIAQNDAKQSDKVNTAGDKSEPDILPIIIVTDKSASDSKTLAQPFVFPYPWENSGKDSPITINDQVIQTLSHGISVAGTTLTPGAPPITISNTPISYGPSLIAIGAITTSLAVKDPKPITTTMAGHIFTIKQTAVEIAGATLTPEYPAITVSGTPISFASSALVIGTSTIPFQTQPVEPLITNIASWPITAAPDGVEVAGTTLHPGDPGMNLDGTFVSLDTEGNFVIGSKTMTLTTSRGHFGDPAALNIADPLTTTTTTTIGNQVITAAPTAVWFGDTTMTPGAPAKTIAGTLISLNPAGRLVIGSKTVTLTGTRTSSDGAAGSGGLSDPSFFTTTSIVDGHSITAAPTAVAFEGTTLTPGASGKTINGTLISLNTAGQLVVGTSTIPLETSSAGLGQLIMGGFGGDRGPSSSSSSSPVAGILSSNGTGNRTTDVNGAVVFMGEAESLMRRSGGWVSWKILAILSAVAIYAQSCPVAS